VTAAPAPNVYAFNITAGLVGDLGSLFEYICAPRITVEGAARLSLCDSDVSCASAAANRSVSERNALVTKTINPPAVATDGLNMQQMLNASGNTASER